MPSVGAVTSNLKATGKTANYTAAANDLVLVDATSGAVTITLPTAPVTNTLVAVKKTDAGTNLVQVVPAGTATIQGDTAMGLVVQGAAATLQYDGTNWQVRSTATINAANAAVGIPAGGTSGQVLAKASATNYDAAWANLPAAAGGGAYPPWGPGRFHHKPVPYGWSSSAPSQTNLTFYPLRIPNACSIGSVYIPFQSNSGGSLGVYCGLFSDLPGAPSGGPVTRLASASSVHSATGNAWWGGALNYTFTAATTVWVGVAMSVTNGVIYFTGYYSSQNFLLQSPTAATPSNNGLWNARVSQVYSYASPPPADVGSSATAVAIQNSEPIFVFQITA